MYVYVCVYLYAVITVFLSSSHYYNYTYIHIYNPGNGYAGVLSRASPEAAGPAAAAGRDRDPIAGGPGDRRLRRRREILRDTEILRY